MSGYGLDIGIERLKEDAATPMELLRALTGRVGSRLWHPHISRKAGRAMLDRYFLPQAREAYEEERWTATESTLSISYRDPGGTCTVDAVCALHWFRLSLAFERALYDERASELGYRLVAPRETVGEAARLSRMFPLMEAKRSLYGVSTDAHDPHLFDNQGRCELTTLSKRERAIFDGIAETGDCRCQLCDRVEAKSPFR